MTNKIKCLLYFLIQEGEQSENKQRLIRFLAKKLKLKPNGWDKIDCALFFKENRKNRDLMIKKIIA